MPAPVDRANALISGKGRTLASACNAKYENVLEAANVSAVPATTAPSRSAASRDEPGGEAGGDGTANICCSKDGIVVSALGNIAGCAVGGLGRICIVSPSSSSSVMATSTPPALNVHSTTTSHVPVTSTRISISSSEARLAARGSRKLNGDGALASM